ncbi:MAG: primosomal protein N' [Bacteroidia bacterium]
MEKPLALFVNVILPLPLARLYTYRVPAEFENETETGKRVVVQFGKKKIYAAVVYELHSVPPKEYEAKNILSVLDEKPVVSEPMLKFWKWISEYYMCSLGDVMKAAMPAPFRLESETKVRLHPEMEEGAVELTDKELLIYEALTLQSELTLSELNQIVHTKNIFPVLKSLYSKSVILLSEELKESYKPKTVKCVKLSAEFENEKNLEQLFSDLDKKPKQLDVIMAYLHLKNENSHIQKSKLIETARSGESSLSTLVKKKIFEEYKLPVDRLESKDLETEEFELNEFQLNALSELKNDLKEKEVALLFGITSSGKTHLYVKMIEEALKQGKQVLYLLPEIAITSQIISRVKKYFGDQAVAFHSRIPQNERVEIWNKIQSGEFKIVIGARSGIFLPFVNLGLVIVDEEHENSYKQQNPAPRYHARDAAIFLASIWQCKTILGSATPSYESFYNCKNGKYALVELNKRFGEIELPEIITANVKEETRVKTMKGSFTTVLYEAIGVALSQQEQVILFQNRRGYAFLQQCRNCQWVPKCTNCDISLTYYKSADILKCHYCGFTQKYHRDCPACGSHLLDLKGIGTENIEEQLKVLFPYSKVSRLDTDSVRSRNGFEKIIHEFEQHESDILIGTQMLGKGFDFEKVSLVGVINADHQLYFPDFRAHERAFQLISQVSGRAGRKKKRGKVIIQTSSPGHHVISSILGYSYKPLFESELQSRKDFAYPPFYRLIKIVFKDKNYVTACDASFFMAKLLEKRFAGMITGPESPPVSRIRGLFIRELLLKIDRNTKGVQELKKFIRDCMNQTNEKEAFRKVFVFADVDPY